LSEKYCINGDDSSNHKVVQWYGSANGGTISESGTNTSTRSQTLGSEETSGGATSGDGRSSNAEQPVDPFAPVPAAR